MAALLLLAVLPGCASAVAGQAAAGRNSGTKVTIMTRSLPGVGIVLVTGNGYALYVFASGNHRAVACTGGCAGTWPPLMLPSGRRSPAAESGSRCPAPVPVPARELGEPHRTACPAT